MLVKTEIPGLARDTTNKAIINTDIEAFKTYKAMRDERLKLRQLSQDVDVLKQDITDIKTMLQQIIKQTEK